VLLLYGQRIDTHLTDPPLGTDRGFPLVFNQPCQILSQSGQGFFHSVGVEFLAFPSEREVVVNTGLKLPFSL